MGEVVGVLGLGDGVMVGWGMDGRIGGCGGGGQGSWSREGLRGAAFVRVTRLLRAAQELVPGIYPMIR